MYIKRAIEKLKKCQSLPVRLYSTLSEKQKTMSKSDCTTQDMHQSLTALHRMTKSDCTTQDMHPRKHDYMFRPSHIKTASVRCPSNC